MVNLQVLLRNPWGKMTFGDTHQKKKKENSLKIGERMNPMKQQVYGHKHPYE